MECHCGYREKDSFEERHPASIAITSSIKRETRLVFIDSALCAPSIFIIT